MKYPVEMLPKEHPIVKALNEMYDPIEPVVWIINFENGTSLSSNSFPTGFLAISQKDREKIRALRFKIGNNTYNISRKTMDSFGNPIIAKGFFYHIKEGRATIFGRYQTDIPFFAERFGFCFNRWGDSQVIRIDHSGYLREVSKRIKKIEELLEKNQAGFIKSITSPPVIYDIEIQQYKENIAGILPGRMLKGPDDKDAGYCYSAVGQRILKQLNTGNLPEASIEALQKILAYEKIPCLRVALNLFADLTLLDELGTTPRITENSKEITSQHESK